MAKYATGFSSAGALSGTDQFQVVRTGADLSATVSSVATYVGTVTAKNIYGTYASRPTAASVVTGSVYVCTDIPEAFYSNGSAWVVLPGGGDLGYAESTSAFTTTSSTPVDVTGLTTSCKVGEKPVYVDFSANVRNQTAGAVAVVNIIANAVNSAAINWVALGGYACLSRKVRITGLTPGSTYTFKIQLSTGGSGTADIFGSSSDRPYIRVSNQ